MKNIFKKFRVMTPDDLPMTGCHINFVRIRAFASGSTAFTEKENAHFDTCRVCRLRLIEELRNMTPLFVGANMSKAA